MKICLDLDEVLFHLHTPAIEALSRITKKQYPGFRFEKWELDPLSDEEKKIMLENVFRSPEVMGNLKPFPYAESVLRRWWSNGHVPYVVTHRPAEIEACTVLMVRKYFPFIKEVVVTEEPKRAVMLREGLQICVDDSPKVIEKVLDINVLIFMVSNEWTRYNYHLRGNSRLTVVESLPEVRL